MTEQVKKKRPPRYLFALGVDALPGRVVASDGVAYVLVKTFKHDFWAATGLYHREGSPEILAVAKFQRAYHLWGLPLKWLGRMIANHEIRIYKALQGLPGIPKYLGETAPNGFVHEFIPGVDLHAELPLTAEFFEQLAQMLRDLQARHIAYVDTNKRENILYGEDGRPWLIDFQISYQANPRNPVGRLILRKLVAADWYHFYKHKTRLLPGACSEEDFAKAKRRGFLHEVHRVVAQPVIRVRRKFLSRYDLSKTK